MQMIYLATGIAFTITIIQFNYSVQNGLNTLQGSMCDHLQTLLSKLSTSGQLHLSTTGPPHADNSLLNVDKSYWNSASAKITGNFIRNAS